MLEEKHPGVSKGIHAKEASEGNGLYNQNISPNSILIEVGPVLIIPLKNATGATDWLAEAISGSYFEREKSRRTRDYT